jgi:hypothetical protein
MEAEWEAAFMALGLTTLLAIGILVIAFDEPVDEPTYPSSNDAEWGAVQEEAQNPIIITFNETKAEVTEGEIIGTLSLTPAE